MTNKNETGWKHKKSSICIFIYVIYCVQNIYFLVLETPSDLPVRKFPGSYIFCGVHICYHIKCHKWALNSIMIFSSALLPWYNPLSQSIFSISVIFVIKTINTTRKKQHCLYTKKQMKKRRGNDKPEGSALNVLLVNKCIILGTALTTSSFSTLHLALMDWAKTTAKWDEIYVSF